MKINQCQKKMARKMHGGSGFLHRRPSWPWHIADNPVYTAGSLISCVKGCDILSVEFFRIWD
jgi:hypothetical protein